MVKLEENSAKKARTHNVYKNAEGKRVPSVTTITGILNKPALVNWANKLGLEGIEVGSYVDDLARIGTLAHYMIECHINSAIKNEKIKPELDDYSKNQIDSAVISFDKFLRWEDEQEIEYLHSELWLVSEKHQFGGCLDCLAVVNGKTTLIDIKTCKAVYKDHFLQTSGGYGILADENNKGVQDVRIIRVGRNNEEGTEAEDVLIPNSSEYRRLFHRCLEIYKIKKGLKWR